MGLTPYALGEGEGEALWFFGTLLVLNATAAGEPAAERVLPPDAPPDMAKIAAAAERFGVEILGPPPGTA